MRGLWSRPEAPVLESDGLRLRLPRPADFEPWQALRERSRRHLKPFEPRWTLADLGQKAFNGRLRRTARLAAEGSEFSFFLFAVEKEDERLIGGLTLSNIRYRAACHASLGYWMGADHAGHGHMTRAVGMAMRFAFDKLHLKRMHAACLPHNAASRRVLEKNGFVEEGFAEKYLQIDGRWQDHVLFGLTDERFAALNKPQPSRL